MKNLNQWLDLLHFSTPGFLRFFEIIFLMVLVLLAVVFLKHFFRPAKSKYSNFPILGKDFMWAMLIIICCFSVIALAGPYVVNGFTISQGGNVDVIVWMDYSFSMKADDIKPSRQELAKKVAIDVVGYLKPGDRITLFVFGENTIWRMPLSEDYPSFVSKVQEVEHPDVYIEESQLSTDYTQALEYAPMCLNKQEIFAKNNPFGLEMSKYSNTRVGIFLSDGNNEAEENLARGIAAIKKAKIKLYTVAIGTSSGSKVSIQARDSKDPSKPVEKISLDTKVSTKDLAMLADQTGGQALVLDSEKVYMQSLRLLKNSIDSNRSYLPRLVYSNDRREIWWEVLGFPSLFFLALIIWRK